MLKNQLRYLFRFFSIWNDGVVPPFVTVDEKVTGVPEQILLTEDDIVIDGVSIGLTLIVIALLKAVSIERQLLFEVRTQVIISPSFKEPET